MNELFTRYIHLPPRVPEVLGSLERRPAIPLAGSFRPFRPDLDLCVSPSGYTIRLDVPGVRFQALEITVQGREVVIRGRRDPESDQPGEGIWRGERGFGAFERRVSLPEAIVADRVEAALESGVLTLSAPTEKSPEGRKIPVGHPRRFFPFGR